MKIKKLKVYLAGQSNFHDNDWKKLFSGITECIFHDPEVDSNQTSPDTFFPDDMKAVRTSDFLVANPGMVSSEGTWIEIGYFYAHNTKSPGDFCNKLIIIWQENRLPKWSIEFAKKTGFVVSTFEEAKEKLKELIKEKKT